MLTRDEIEAFMDDEDAPHAVVHRSATVCRPGADAGARAVSLATQTQLSMMRQWQRSMTSFF